MRIFKILVFIFGIMISGYNSGNSQEIAKEGAFKQTINQIEENKAHSEREGYIQNNVDTNCPISINDFSYTKIDGLQYQIKLKDESKRKYQNDNNVQWFFAFPETNGWKIVKEFEPLIDFSYVPKDKRKYNTQLWKKITSL